MVAADDAVIAAPKSYLKIENYRYKNKFTYSFEVEESCLSYLCNKITLQPIIENAIYHGVKQMIDEGEIWIRIFEDGEYLLYLRKSLQCSCWRKR